MAITGETDVVTDGRRTCLIDNGHAMMGRVTGTGCAATAIIGAFCGAGSDSFAATVAALSYYGYAGERAAQKSSGPGHFWPAMLDNLYRIQPDELDQGARITLSEDAR